MSIIERIRAHGGEVVRDRWQFSLKPGRLPKEAIDWLRGHLRDVCREAWPSFDDWEERAAIREFDGGQLRHQAEASAYAEVAK